MICGRCFEFKSERNIQAVKVFYERPNDHVNQIIAYGCFCNDCIDDFKNRKGKKLEIEPISEDELTFTKVKEDTDIFSTFNTDQMERAYRIFEAVKEFRKEYLKLDSGFYHSDCFNCGFTVLIRVSQEKSYISATCPRCNRTIYPNHHIEHKALDLEKLHSKLTLDFNEEQHEYVVKTSKDILEGKEN